MTTLKRKRVELTLQQKSDILLQIDRGKSQKQVAAEFNIGTSTVSDIVKKRSSIFEKLTSGYFNARRIRDRSTPHKIIDKALLDWFHSIRATNVKSIQGSDLLQKSKEFAVSLGSNVSISISWINRWKERHGLVSLKYNTSKSSTNTIKPNETNSTSEASENITSPLLRDATVLTPVSITNHTEIPSIDRKYVKIENTTPEYNASYEYLEPVTRGVKQYDESETENGADEEDFDNDSIHSEESWQKTIDPVESFSKKRKISPTRSENVCITCKHTEDEIDIFLKHVSSQLRKLNIQSALKLQSDIQHLITEARLKDLLNL